MRSLVVLLRREQLVERGDCAIEARSAAYWVARNIRLAVLLFVPEKTS
jgi:hypothetical protein